MNQNFLNPWYASAVSPFIVSPVELMQWAIQWVLALIVLAVGYFVARVIRDLVVKGAKSLSNAKVLAQSPLGEFTKNEEMTATLQKIAGTIGFWLVMLVVFEIAASTAGLTALADLFSKILSYLPNVLVATVILVLGILLAGIAEMLVKSSLRGFKPHFARLMARFVSYFILGLTVLIALSELGIAREYILILFIGFVSCVALGVGLAFGLGGQHVVKEMLESGYQKIQDQTK